MGNGQWAMGIGHWATGIGQWALGIGNNSFPNPQSLVPSPQSLVPNYYLSQNLKLKPSRERRKRRVGLRLRLIALSFGSSP
jgi:hypothetical protein